MAELVAFEKEMPSEDLFFRGNLNRCSAGHSKVVLQNAVPNHFLASIELRSPDRKLRSKEKSQLAPDSNHDSLSNDGGWEI